MLPILTIVLLACIFVAVQSMRVVIRNPSALRSATRSEESQSYASYSYVFLSAQMVPFLMLALKKYQPEKNKLFRIVATAGLFASMGLSNGMSVPPSLMKVSPQGSPNL